VHYEFGMILLKLSNGRVLQGVVLSFGDQLMRVAIKDADDAVEFRLINGRWISEDCEIARIEFASQGATFEVHDDFLDALLTAEASVLPVRVM
jgi:hypothetical protein